MATAVGTNLVPNLKNVNRRVFITCKINYQNQKSFIKY